MQLIFSSSPLWKNLPVPSFSSWGEMLFDIGVSSSCHAETTLTVSASTCHPLCVLLPCMKWFFFFPSRSNTCNFVLCLCKDWPKWPWPETGCPRYSCSINSYISSSWEIAVNIHNSDNIWYSFYYRFHHLMLKGPEAVREKYSKSGAWSRS